MAFAALIPLIAAGITAIGSWFSSKQNNDANAKLYEKQRQDNLADYTMQNDYNSPTSQMSRLRAGGLNPMLAYGSVNNMSAPVKSTDTKPNTPTDYGLIGSELTKGLGAYQDYNLKKQQTDNLKSQNTVLAQEAILKASQVAESNMRMAKMGVDISRSKFDLTQTQRLADTNAQAAAENVRKTQAETQMILDNNQRAAVAQSSSLMEAAERIRNLKTTNTQQQVQIDNLLKDGILKDLDIQLKRQGLNPGDPLWQRKAVELFNRFLPTPQKFAEGVDSFIDGFMYPKNPATAPGWRKPKK